MQLQAALALLIASSAGFACDALSFDGGAD